MRKLRIRNLLVACGLATAWFASTVQVGAQPLNITGVANNTTYTDTATFTVPTDEQFNYLVLLNTNVVPAGASYTITQADYYKLSVWRTNLSTLEVTNRSLQFIVKSSVRGSTEDGLPPWTPYPTIASSPQEFAGAHLRLVAPQAYPTGMVVPVVAWVENDAGHAVRVNGRITAPGQSGFAVKRGVGSGFLSARGAGGLLNYQPTIGGLTAAKDIAVEDAITWTPVSGTLSGTTVWPADSRIAVTGNLRIPAGSMLTIGAGTIVRLSFQVNITNQGTVTINGTVENPVVFASVNRKQPWGGFFMEVATARLDATGTIFTGSGARPTGFPGHRVEQCLFFCANSPRVTLTDCAAIALAGQFGHSGSGGTFVFNRVLIQGCTTGGEYTGCSFTVNDSAIMDVPEDSPTFVDGDNDGIYLVSGNHNFTNTLFGWTKDDGIDSGGGGAGVFIYQDCWFESTFHEANSLSGTGKDVRHQGSVFINCGQGLEDGYDAPTGRVDRCLAVGNLVGARFGDNYNWTYNGFLTASNSLLLYNYHDVWGMNWADWTYRTNQMRVVNNYLSAPNAYHPNSTLWDPLADGWRLTNFLTTPPTAAVGIGFALWNRYFSVAQITNGLPVRLSSFTPQTVTVDYVVEVPPGQTVASGTLEFQAGETVKWIPVALAQPQNHQIVRATLKNPLHGEITGLGQVYGLNLPGSPTTVPATLVAKGSSWRYNDNGADLGTAWRSRLYNDAAWPTGTAQLGFGDGDERTVIRRVNGSGTTNITCYFRKTLEVTNPAAYQRLNLWLLRDDAGVVYLNGTEVFRSPNLPAYPAVIAYGTFATAGGENTVDTAVANVTNLVAGMNVLAVEIHQQNLPSSDLSFDMELTATLAPPPPMLGFLANFGQEIMLIRRVIGYADDVVHLWPTAGTDVLEEAPSLDGPWSPVAGGTPIVVHPVEHQTFFRLRPAP